MSHATFEHIKGTENILADHILRLWSMGLYGTLEQKEGEKELGCVMFEELSLISGEQNELPPFSLKYNELIVNEIQHPSHKIRS